jgi:signal transduction histidine kinase
VMDAAQAPAAGVSTRRTDRLARVVGRVPLPLGAKLVLGFAAIAALLVVGYSLGLVALGQSNSRGGQLLRLQHQAVYLQIVLTDATQLQKAIEYRSNTPGSTKAFGGGLDQAIGNDMEQLCVDSGSPCLIGAQPSPFHLGGVDPQAFRLLTTSVPIFYTITGNSEGGATGSVASVLRRADRFATSFAAQVGADTQRTRARANTLVAANRDSFARSRALLVGGAAASVILALGLGLLLAWSVVAPLRRTEERLVEIGAGDFSGRLDVANRDEIGRLAERVNSTSDELQRVYAELEAASRHKSDFLATMSHELRTPLNAIIGFSEVLREQMFGELNERQLAYVEDVLEAGRHLLSLINDVLDLAKIEAGRMELELSEVELPTVLRSAVSLHSEAASRGGIELSLQSEPEEITVTADERRVRQVVVNLLSNAVKFTPQDGHVDVTAGVDDGYVEIAVADTGPGIPPEDLEAIFEEFEQSADGKKAEGTGLGLPLSRMLVELHGGRLWVDSRPGHGSTFRFTLPVHQEVS